MANTFFEAALGDLQKIQSPDRIDLCEAMKSRWICFHRLAKPLERAQSCQDAADGFVHTVLFRETLLGREALSIAGKGASPLPKSNLQRGKKKKKSHRARQNP